jgi:hypothetical protein
VRRFHQLILTAVAVASVAAGCAKVQARAEPEMPLLSPPPPPPRLVETYIDEPVPTIEPSPADTALATPPRIPPKPPVARPDTAAKPEPPRVEPERPVTAPPALTLKPAPGGETKTDASIRDLMGRAAKDLNRVNYTALNGDRRAQYDTARRFMQQADEALKAGNVVFAGKLADKAATMAAVLVR